MDTNKFEMKPVKYFVDRNSQGAAESPLPLPADRWRPHRLVGVATARGRGVHTGKVVTISISPRPHGDGIIFVRDDLGCSFSLAQAKLLSSNRSTVIGMDSVLCVGMVEHLLAALYAWGISDCQINLDGSELPIFDGSALPYAELLQRAQLETVNTILAYRICKPHQVQVNDSHISFKPARQLQLDVTIDYPHPMIRQQQFGNFVAGRFFNAEVAAARTFGFFDEQKHLLGQLLSQGADLSNVLVFDTTGVMNKEGLRYLNECARHKWLDLLGDLYITGKMLMGHITALRPGHKVNAIAINDLFAQRDKLELVELNFT